MKLGKRRILLQFMGAVFDRNAQDYQARRAAHEKAARGVGIELVSVEFTNLSRKIGVRARLPGDTERRTDVIGL